MVARRIEICTPCGPQSVETIPDGLSSGMRPSDFDRGDLEEGTEVEMEHTTSRQVAQRIAMDHLVEDRDYYRKLRKMHAEPNRRRVKVYDAEDLARNMVKVFKDRDVEYEVELFKEWPVTMQQVGDSLSVGYSSDKWRQDDKFILYKHLAESRNRAFCKRGFLRDYDNPDKAMRTIGPTIDFSQVPMPKHFCELAIFEEACLVLHVGGSNDRPQFGKNDDDGVIQVVVAHGYIGGSFIQWSKTPQGGKDQPFLFVYTQADGPMMVIVGDELDVEADGIVG